MRTGRQRTVWSNLARIAVLVTSAMAVLPASAQADVAGARAVVDRTQRAVQQLHHAIGLFDEALLIASHDVELGVQRIEHRACASATSLELRAGDQPELGADPRIRRAAIAIERQLARSTRALNRAVHRRARLVGDRRDATVRCIDGHLSLTSQRIAELEQLERDDMDHVTDGAQAARHVLRQVELREYRLTHGLLRSLRDRIVTHSV